MTSEIYADGKRKKIDDEILNTAATLRKRIQIKAFTSCRFLLSKHFQELRIKLGIRTFSKNLKLNAYGYALFGMILSKRMLTYELMRSGKYIVSLRIEKYVFNLKF